MLNSVTLIGRLTKDPEVRYGKDGSAMAKFTVAVNRELKKEKKAEMEREGKPTADFINVTMWGRSAEALGRYTEKGLLIAVTGRIQTGKWQTKEGENRYSTEVVADRVKFIEWAKDNRDGFTEIDIDDVPF